MKMKKLIKKWGESLVIVFNKEDRKIYPSIKEGNVLEFTITNCSKKKEGDE